MRGESVDLGLEAVGLGGGSGSLRCDICRGDARSGRLYLPRAWLRRKACFSPVPRYERAFP